MDVGILAPAVWRPGLPCQRSTLHRTVLARLASRPAFVTLVPRLPESVPRHRGAVRRAIGLAGLRILRWRVAGNLPDEPRMVIAVAPHTSNWDFVVGFMAYLALELQATWFGKHTLFRWPLGVIFRRFGGIPIERTRSANVVELYVREFERRDRMVLAIAPEGTRKRVPEWKSGFYHIAVGAGVPIVPVALDFSSRLVRILPPLHPTGDAERDIATLRARFQTTMARHPANYAE